MAKGHRGVDEAGYWPGNEISHEYAEIWLTKHHPLNQGQLTKRKLSVSRRCDLSWASAWGGLACLSPLPAARRAPSSHPY